MRELSALGQIVVVGVTAVLAIGIAHACQVRDEERLISPNEASQLYSCVAGMYGKPIAQVVQQCGGSEHEAVIQGIYIDLATFDARQKQCNGGDAGGNDESRRTVR